MDESLPRFVHGRTQRQRYLETTAHPDCVMRPRLWWIQRARVAVLPAVFTGHCATGHESAKISDRSSSPQTGANGAHDPAAKRTAEVSDAFKNTDDPLFRSIRSGTIHGRIPIGARNGQHGNCALLNSVLSARLALLDCYWSHWLFA